MIHPRRSRLTLLIVPALLALTGCQGNPTGPDDTRTGPNGPSMIGTWDGVVSNHPGSFNYGPIRSFVLRLNAEPGGTQAIGQWSDNLGCSTSSVMGLVSGGVPTISVESLRCNDGDFWIQATSLTANAASGRCRGGSCTFRMTKR